MSETHAARRVVLVTGGNSGVGLECARSLARSGWRVLLASRDRERSARAARDLADDAGNPAVEALELDLGSLRSVRRFAGELLERPLPLHALVCNAGIQIVSGLLLSEDGHEATFAVNHLGHFLLANLLLPRLLESAPARILVVSSGVHDPRLRTGMPKPSLANFESLASPRAAPGSPYNGRLAYVNSKLCNLLFAYELARRLEASGLCRAERPVSVNAFEPGLVPGSRLARDYGPAARFVWDRILPLLRLVTRRVNSPRRAGSALARLVQDPALERSSGRYFASHAGFGEARSSDESYDPGKARALWETSAKLCALAPDESPLAA